MGAPRRQRRGSQRCLMLAQRLQPASVDTSKYPKSTRITSVTIHNMYTSSTTSAHRDVAVAAGERSAIADGCVKAARKGDARARGQEEGGRHSTKGKPALRESGMAVSTVGAGCQSHEECNHQPSLRFLVGPMVVVVVPVRCRSGASRTMEANAGAIVEG